MGLAHRHQGVDVLSGERHPGAEVMLRRAPLPCEGASIDIPEGRRGFVSFTLKMAKRQVDQSLRLPRCIL